MKKTCLLIWGEEVICEGTEKFCRDYFERLLDPLPMRIVQIAHEKTLVANIGSTRMGMHDFIEDYETD